MESPTVEAGVSPAGKDPSSQNASVEASAKTDDELTTLLGGIEIEVWYADGPKKGTSETVKIRQVPISKIQALATAIGWGNEAQCIELYCDQQPGWADTLEYKSANEVAEKGMEINRPFFNAWSARQARWKQSFIQSAIEDAAKRISKIVSPSPNSQPQSPSGSTGSPGR